MQLAVVVLGTLVGLLLWDVTVQRCAREAAEERAEIWRAVAFINGRRVRALERLMAAPRDGLRHASRMLRALADVVAGR